MRSPFSQKEYHTLCTKKHYNHYTVNFLQFQPNFCKNPINFASLFQVPDIFLKYAIFLHGYISECQGVGGIKIRYLIFLFRHPNMFLQNPQSKEFFHLRNGYFYTHCKKVLHKPLILS